jgi:RimJ/RimL family protein N-acetyltransferase
VTAATAGRRVATDGVVALREVTSADAEDLYRWRMDPSARPMFRQSDLVPFETHRAFVDRHLAAGNGDRWFVIEAEGTAVGAIALYAFAKGGAEAEWGRFVIDPGHRGRGWGRRALRLLVEHARSLGVRTLRCEVRAGNPVEGLYRELGFREGARATAPAPDGVEPRFIALERNLDSDP